MQLRRGPAAPLLVAFLAIVVAAPPALAHEAPAARQAMAAAAAAAAAKPYRLDLADGNDFVAQTTFVQCVGASIQMMLNIEGAGDRTARTQLRAQALARSLSGPTRAGFQRKGASVVGWTGALNQLDAGAYRMVGTDTLQEAVHLAAAAIRETGRPVGLLVWAGRHAWVMSGFEATADPRQTDRFRVTRAIVLDPLYPFGSAKWGRSPRPREAITVATLGRQFVPRRRGVWAGAVTGSAGQSLSALAGKYVIVMPYMPIVIARTFPIAT